MTHIPIQLPFKGFTEQSQFSAIPQGMTPSCLNMMPTDVWNGRMRISTRNGTRLYEEGAVQFLGQYRVYEGVNLVEKIIVVKGGKVYYGDPRSTLPGTLTLFGSGSPHTQATPKLNTTGLVEGVQFNEHFYFVDGDHYVFVKLATPSSATAVQAWGNSSPKHGPYHTDPDNVQAGERATLICRWGARLVLAGYRRTPNIWYACEPDATYPHEGAGGPTDGWTGNNYIGAISGSTFSDFGTLGDPIVAIFPFAQTGLMFGCTNSFSFLTNDPLFEDTASIVSLTRSIGITGKRAFCQSQEKGAFILANDGLYFINANDFNFNRANRVSAGRLDSFFLRLDFGTPAIGGSGSLSGGTLRSLLTESGTAAGVNAKVLNSSGSIDSEPTSEKVSLGDAAAAVFGDIPAGEVFPVLCYDPDREGVWAFLSVSGIENASVHLFYDLKTDSFWPQKFADPKMFAPTSAVYLGNSRKSSGRLFLGGTASTSIIEKSFPIGIDGWDSEMTDEDQRRQFIRSSLTFGPLIANLPYRMMLNEIRVDLADDNYEVPSDFTDLSTYPILSVTTGDTAQIGLGIQTDVLFVINQNPLVVDGGNAAGSGPTPLYDGGDAAVGNPPNTIDGRYAIRPFGEYEQNDPFAAGTQRVYAGPGSWILKYYNGRWVIAIGNDVEYEQITSDQGSPNGPMVTFVQAPVSPDEKDIADVSGGSFPGNEVIEISELVYGRNTAKKCRIRSEAMYLTIASDGKPWSIERMSVVASQVGKSRGDP